MKRQLITFLVGVVALPLLLGGCGSVQSAPPSAEQILHGMGDLTWICSIQGAGHQSPLERQQVSRIPGIITGIIPMRGFYMQNPVPDGSDATSEGIYVHTKKVAELLPGDLVIVDAKVEEYYPSGESSGNLSITRLRFPEVEVLARGLEIPDPVVLGEGGRLPPTDVISGDSTGDVEESPFNPDIDGIDFYESLEGMYVQVNEPIVVGDIHTLYGEFQIVGDSGRRASLMTPRGGLVLRESDFNPERIVVDVIEAPPLVDVGNGPAVVVGDSFAGPIRGILSYDFYVYKILPTEMLPELIPGKLPREVSALEVSDRDLTIGSFNIQNYSAVSDPAKTRDIAETIAVAMGGPDIVVLSEVQDGNGEKDDGTVDADASYRVLVDEILRRDGPGYAFLEVAPVDGKDGGAPGGNIRVGFLYNPDRVEFAAIPDPAVDGSETAATLRSGADGAQLFPNPGRIEPENNAFVASRKPLVGRFTFRGRPVYVIGVHLNSKGGDSALFARRQPPVFASEGKRVRQAATIRDFVARIRLEDPDAAVVVAGDFNDFQFTEVLRVAKGDELVNLVEELLPEEERYSYVYQGNAQALDHLLVSKNVFEGGKPRVQILHRYAGYLYGERQTDHDPILAAISMD